jgi:hypothetical protein
MQPRKAWITLRLLTLAFVGTTAGAGPALSGTSFTVSSSIGQGATLSGSVTWTAAPSAETTKVRFLIDGALRWTENDAPYQFNGDPSGVLDTTTLSDGGHTLAVKAYPASGKTAVTKVSLTVANGSSQSGFTVSSSINDGATLSGSLIWTATPNGSAVSKVTFLIDGVVRWTEAFSPYFFNGDPSGALDTSTLTDGAHVLAVIVYATDGRTASASSSVTVANGSTSPVLSGSIPAPSGTARVGQTLTAGTGTWAGTQPIAYTFQWQRCSPSCGDISGATSSTYLLVSADVGSTIQVRVTAANGAGSASATSATTALIQSSPSSWTGFVGTNAYRTSDLAQIAATGVKRVRMDNPSASTITAAASYGIDMLPIADYEPWPDLNGGKGDKYPPLPQYYQTWAVRMIAQWTSLPNPPVAIEVWNEPWLTSFWQPTPDPSAYYNLVRVFATEAWKVWPNVKILVSADTVGSTNTTGTNLWRKYVLAADAAGFLNDPRIQPTTHNYVEGRTPTTVTSQPCYWDLDRFKCAYNDFKAHGNPDPQVWVTEYGWESDTPSSVHYHDTVSEQQQADYTTQALSIFKSSGMVAAAYAFCYKTGETWSYDWLRPDNSAKPVVSAVGALINGG